MLRSASIYLNKLFVLGSPALQRTPTKGNQPGNENLHGTSSNLVYIRSKPFLSLTTWDIGFCSTGGSCIGAKHIS